MSVIRLEKQIKGKTKSSGFFIIYYNMCIYYSFRTSLMHTHSHKYTITCDEIEEFSVESLNNKRGTYNVQRTTPTSTQLTVYTRREKKNYTITGMRFQKKTIHLYTRKKDSKYLH